MGTRRSLVVGHRPRRACCARPRRVSPFAARFAAADDATGPAPVVELPNRAGLVQVRGPRRLRHRRARRSTRSAEQMAKLRARFPFELVITVGDNIYGGERPQDMRRKFEDPVQAAARRRREVLRLARQPRRPRAAPLQAVQHGRPDVLHLQGAEAGRAVLRARDRLPRRRNRWRGSRRSCRARARTGRSPTSTIRSTRRARRHGSHPDLARGARAAVPEGRRQRGVHRPRSLLRADQAAEGHRLLRRRVGRQAAARRHRPRRAA